MSGVRRVFLISLLAAAPLLSAAPALAQNDQVGNNSADTDQGGESESGDAIAGSVTGVTSSGDTRLDATNRSRGVDVESGDAEGNNTADAFAGQSSGDVTTTTTGPNATITSDISVNSQEGDNSVDIAQAARATSGDAVGGQVIGVVTSAGSTADVVAANTSQDTDVQTGEATAGNESDAFAGQVVDAASISAEANTGDGAVGNTANISGPISFNSQEGDNNADISQASQATTGDGVGGQVIGVVTSGGSSSTVDATNNTRDSKVESGDADASNNAEAAAGQSSDETSISAAAGTGDDAHDNTATISEVSLNSQEGDNTADISQSSQATTGDGVGGQVIGVVASAGSTADVVAANTTRDTDVESGEADADSDADASAGQSSDETFISATAGTADAGDEVNDDNTATIFNVSLNSQQGDNTADIFQTSQATTGDGVGGQVIGVVASGASSSDVDATNTTQDTDVETGQADADSDADASAGQSSDEASISASAGSGRRSDDNNATIFDLSLNSQQGDNTADISQASDATTGDGVGGQVIGVVTSGGSSSAVVAANTTQDTDVETGESVAVSDAEASAGQSAAGAAFSAVAGAGGGADDNTATISGASLNSQQGDNAADISQASSSTTGDGVGGQVIGLVTSGESTSDVDATNSTSETEVDTGDASSRTDAEAEAGQGAEETAISAAAGNALSADDNTAAISEVSVNSQEGDNSSDINQAATSASGDGVGGQVVGVVISDGGSTDVVVANTARGVDAETGDSSTDDDSSEFVGQDVEDFTLEVIEN